MSTITLAYTEEARLSPEEFTDILNRSGLGTRRPIGDPDRIRTMVEKASLIITARDGGKLVGVARSLTDFCYCCYLSDLAVDEAYQHQGIGKKLIEETQKRLGENTLLLLLAAPAATAYYPKIGFSKEERAWSLRPTL